jgi:molecular chaperone GrpE
MCNDELLESLPSGEENPADETTQVELASEPQDVSVQTEDVAEPKENDLPPPPNTDWSELSEKLQSLETLFSRRLSYDAGKEKILDKLHAELQDYKSDIYAKLTRPIFYDIAVVLDDIRKIRSGLDTEKQSDSDALVASIAESLVFLLDKYEVLPYASEPGTKYDATKQRMVRTKGTSDPTQVGLIAESISDGYLQNDQVIYPEKIVAYKLEVM